MEPQPPDERHEGASLPAGEGHARPTPGWALALPSMPAGAHFRRDHFPIPAAASPAFSLAVTGAVGTPLTLSLDDLRALPTETATVVLECAGHRRTEHVPAPSGVPWAVGAVGHARWTGVALATVLARAGVAPGAVGVVLWGADAGSFDGLEGEHRFARALPLAKATAPETLLAWEMDGGPLPEEHGGPLRAVVPGWYATDSVKWLTEIEVVHEPFDGPFEALDYRLKGEGLPAAGIRMTEVPVHALVTSPASGEWVPGATIEARGIAWGGRGGVAIVEVRMDDGPWTTARLVAAAGPYAPSFWSASCPGAPGLHTLAVRATDGAGDAQPDRPPPNPGGYANSSVHRVEVTVT